MIGPDVGRVSGIVLAGGRSSRFGSDKLAAVIGSDTLLERSIAALAMVVDEIVVVVGPTDERTIGPIPGRDRPIRIVRDGEAHGGPLVGLLAGLEVVAHPLVLVVGGDMPDLQPDVLALMVGTLAVDMAAGAVVLRARGEVVPLPAALRTAAGSDVARSLVLDGERRLRSVFERLPTRILADGEWRPLDPEGATLRDVDVPADLPRD